MRELSCTCSCGKVSLALAAAPFARFICHCTICQSVYRAPFADVTILWARSVALNERQNVQFKKHRGPPALSRGICTSCARPAIAYLAVAPAIRLAFIPTYNYPAPTKLSTPAMHIFYQSRSTDAHDDLPKYSGYWRSQLAVMGLVARSAFNRRADA